MSKTLVYRYGLLPPTKNAELINSQILYGHRYKNKLTEIEQERRNTIRTLKATHPDIAPLEEMVQSISKECVSLVVRIKELKSKIKFSDEKRGLQKELKAVRVDLKEKKKELTIARKLLGDAKHDLNEDAEVQAAMSEANEKARVAQKEARSETEAYWGTYLLAEASADLARKNTPWHSDPSFKRWDGSGVLGAQLQGGLETAKAFYADRRLQIKMRSPLYRPAGVHGPEEGTNLPELLYVADVRDGEQTVPAEFASLSKRRLRRRFGTLRVRINRVDGQDIWGEWPILMHRPLPVNAEITWVKVVKKRIADEYTWSVHFTLRLPDWWQREESGDGICAVDVGWRKLEDGSVRIAYLYDEDGGGEELIIDKGVLSGLRKCEDLQSIRSKTFNTFHAVMAPKLKELATEDCPAWFSEEVQHVNKWKGARRYYRLLRLLKEEGWEEFENVQQEIAAWVENDRHLWRWQANQREKSLGRRLDQYRVWAAEIARHYSIAVIEDFNLKETQKHVAPESEETEVKAARGQQRDAAISELRLALLQAFQQRGGLVYKVNPSMTTQQCALCGYTGRWDAAPHVEHTCEGCSETWDQDLNAAKNILNLHLDGKSKSAFREVKAARWEARHTKAAKCASTAISP